MTQYNRMLRPAYGMIGLFLASVFVAVAGCQDMDASIQQSSSDRHPSDGENFRRMQVTMADNALLAEMSMSSVHFVPNSDELNALGVSRLMRYARILKVYGGTLAYDGTDPDRSMRHRRVERLEEFLVDCGLETDEFSVIEGMAGSISPADASEAIAVRQATRGPGDVESVDTGTMTK